jgi:hypothetical protein
MISIRNEIRTAEDLQTLLLAVCENYRAAIEDSSQYAIEIDSSITPAHREALRKTAARISAEEIGAAQTLPSLRSTVRNVLRDYKERAENYLADLRNRLEEHAKALQTVLGALAADSEDQEKKLHREMERLGEIAAIDNLDELRAGVLELKRSLEACVAEIEKRNRITVAELNSEIHALQKQVLSLTSPASKASGVFGVRERVEAEMTAGNSFLLLFVRVRNLESVRSRFGPDLTGRVVQCALKRLANLPARDITVGCWQEGILCALVPDCECSAVDLAREANNRLGGKYVFTESDRVIEIPAQIVTVSLERPRDDTPERTAARIHDTLALLGG